MHILADADTLFYRGEPEGDIPDCGLPDDECVFQHSTACGDGALRVGVCPVVAGTSVVGLPCIGCDAADNDAAGIVV